MKKGLVLSALISFSVLSPCIGQTVDSDTIKASKLAQKASKLFASGKEKKINKAIDLYKEAGSMGLPSACRFLSSYYMGTTPPDVDQSLHWLEILGDLGDSLSIVKLVDVYSGKLSAEGYPSEPNVEKVREWSKSLADKGSMQGMEAVASTYLQAGDTTQALGWLEKAAEAGSLPSHVALSKLYSGASNLAPELSFEHAMKASELGDKECTYAVANMYMTGFGCEQDFSKAYSYFEKCEGLADADLGMNMAYCKIQMNEGKIDDTVLGLLVGEATKGNVTAQRILGDSYANGNGVATDASKALEWYMKAADQGDAYSQYASSVFLLSGKAPIVQDHAKGIAYLEKAAASGLPGAQNDLAMFYLGGQFVEKDVAKGLKLMEESSAAGNPYSRNTLGSIYYQGELVQKDVSKALKLFQSAAVQGLPDAQFNTGYFYLNDEGTSGLTHEERLVNDDLKKEDETAGGKLTDKQIGIYWLRKSSEAGYPLAQSNLAYLILGGQAVGTESEAVALLEKASEQGVVDAQYTLGTLYFNGNAGLTKDVKKGAEYVKKAADQGNLQAQKEIGMLYLNGEAGIAKNEKTGFKYMKMAADQGLPAAMFYTGICYLQGMGVGANLTEGKKWIKKASTQTADPEVKKAASDVLKQLP